MSLLARPSISNILRPGACLDFSDVDFCISSILLTPSFPLPREEHLSEGKLLFVLGILTLELYGDIILVLDCPPSRPSLHFELTRILEPLILTFFDRAEPLESELFTDFDPSTILIWALSCLEIPAN